MARAERGSRCTAASSAVETSADSHDGPRGAPPKTEFCLISEAVARLEAGMFGGLRRSEAVVAAKTSYPGASIGWGPQKEDAAKRIYKAVMQGELSVLVLPDSTDDEALGAPLQVPPDVLGKMMRTRGGLPDRIIRPMRTFANTTVS
jgi:hypothetical protein